MGKTYRRVPQKYHRCPRGRRQAIINEARNGAIPPDAWDDLPVCDEAHRSWHYVWTADKEGVPHEQIRKTLKHKFGLKQWEISKIIKKLVSVNNSYAGKWNSKGRTNFTTKKRNDE
jgi:hypothetical protein